MTHPNHPSSEQNHSKPHRAKRPSGIRALTELFDISPAVTITALVLAVIVVGGSLLYFFHTAPPSSITISSGPEGSAFQKSALKYAKIIGESGVKVNVVTSEGSLQNLQRLADPSSKVDVGIVQAGITVPDSDRLVSLGSISYQPLLVFYRTAGELDLLSQLAGKKVAVGPVGSGSRTFALQLLAANGIQEKGSTTLLDWEADKASKALEDGEIDAAFIMSESASTEIMHRLMRSKAVRIFSFRQASAYSRKVEFINSLDLPEGSVDLGQDIPPHDVSLLGPMVELVATKNLNPALSDLLLEAATQVHNRPGVFQKRGEFPAPIEHAIHLSADATRFYKSGKGFMYRYLPFWFASLVDRILFVLVPMLVFLVPAMRSVPAFFQWRMKRKIHRHYRALLKVEQDFVREREAAEHEQLRREFDRIEDSVNRMKVPASFADQFYGLRGHIDFVRQLLEKQRPA